MRKVVRLTAVVAVLAIVGAACSKSSTPQTSTSASAGAEIQAGGTLNIAQTSDVSAAFDPQKEYYQLSFEYFKCCLLRTLLQTKEVTAEQGGNELQPDLASALPTVSSDGLTYTFSIKPGIHYSPPLQDVTVTAGDFVRAIEREADPKASSGGYPFYYSVIEGFDDYGAGKADTISGITATDDSTLVVKLTQPAGDMPWRFAMPATAPIPPNPSDPKAVLGIADGHTTNFGRFIVGTGPYMFEGTDALDFSVAASDQDPVSGYVPGRSMILVRNPSYDPSTDGLRPAYPDRIETTIGGDVADLYNKVETGEMDYVADTAPPANVLQQYATNPRQAAVPAHDPAERGPVHLHEPGRAAVRRHPCPQGGQPGLRQGGEPAARRRSAHRGHRGAHLLRRAPRQPVEGLQPVRHARRSWRPGGGQGGDGAIQVRLERRRRLRQPGLRQRHRARRAAGPGTEGHGAVRGEREGHRHQHHVEAAGRPRDLLQVHLLAGQVPGLS